MFLSIEKRILHRLLVGGISCLLAGPSMAAANSNWAMRAWRSDEGLPNNNVTGLAQTTDGYLWVGTVSRLARFDGVQFEEIRSNLSTAQHNQGVGAILRARNGCLWVAMSHGCLVCLDSGNARAFTKGLPDLSADSLTEDAEGAIWITYQRGNGPVFRIKDGRVTDFTTGKGLPASWACSLATDRKGTLWFGKGSEVGVFENGGFQSLVEIGKQANVTRITGASAGGVWICCGLQLYRYDRGGDFQWIASIPPASADTEPTVLLEDHLGGLWIGTSDNGLFHYDSSGLEKVPTSHRQILSLMEDQEESMWVGTGGGGLDQVQSSTITMEGSESGLPFEAMQSMCQDSAGDLWAATQDGQLLRRAASGWQTVSTDASWPGGMATCVAAEPATNAIWIGTRSRALYRLVNGKFTVLRTADGLTSHNIHALLSGRAGDLWIGGNSPESLQHYQGGHFYNLQLPGSVGVIQTMVEDQSGAVWAGTSRGTLLRAKDNAVSDETTTLFGGLLSSIRCLYVSARGDLWIGYGGSGLGYYKDGRFFRATDDTGLYDDRISQIAADGRGWLWLGSDRGIFKIKEQEFEDFAQGKGARLLSIRYGQSDGLPSLQANFGVAPGAISSRDGKLWIPTRTGLAVINPNLVPEHLQPPPVQLTRVTMDNQTIASYGGAMPVSSGADLKTLGAAIHLPPGRHRLEFEFTALSFAAPENVQFRYKLDGVDEDWVDGGTQRTARYASVTAGSYKFQVMACNSDGIWNETGATLGFTVAPFFWQTWWFRLGVIAMFTSAVIVVVRYISFQRLQSKVRLLQQQAVVDKERARIARDLHDDLGSRLTKIVMLSELSLQNRADAGRVFDRIAEVSNTARQVVKSLDQTVWAVNPRNDPLPELINYIGQFAVDFLRSANIRCHVDLLDAVSDAAASAEVRHNLLLAVKEALNNIVRHAAANEVRITTTFSRNLATLIIEDDGRGFESAANNGTADGLRNMQARMSEIGGRFYIESKPGDGTRIHFTFPCRCEDGNRKREPLPEVWEFS